MIDVDRKKIAILLVLLVTAGLVVGASSEFTTISSNGDGTVLSAGNGPSVTLVGNTDVYTDSGGVEGGNGVRWNTSDGDITFVSQGDSNATVHKDNITGTWTTVSGLDVATNGVRIDAEDKRAINVSGDLDRIKFRDATLDNGQADFVYAGTAGSTNVTVRGVAADTQIRAVDKDTGDLLAGGTSDGSGTVELTEMPNSEHTVTLESSEGGPGISDPHPEGTLGDFPSELSVNVSDPDFDSGDNVSVEFFLDGNSVGNNSTTSAQRVSTSISQPSRGDHTAKAIATDSTGNQKEITWTFSIANELEIRNVTDPHGLIDDRTVELKFYEDGDIYTRSTSDGTLNLTGLPTDGDIIGEAKTDGFKTGYFLIEDLGKQQSVYLLHDSVTSVEVRFTLRDRTGNFDGNGAQLEVQKAINRSETKWHTVYGDEFDAADAITADLEEGQRYRLVLKNEDNDIRILGTYDADVSETVELTVGTVDAVPEGTGLEYAWNASYVNESASSTNYVQFEYNDSKELTEDLTVKIYQRGNESNVLLSNQTFSGPVGTLSLSEPVPEDQEDVTWVVEATGQRDGEQIYIKEPIGDRQPILTSMPGWLKTIISIGSIWIVAGLFSQLNGDVGALVTAGLGGIWWWVDFLPQEAGVGVVVLSMITAGIVFINERRGGAV